VSDGSPTPAAALRFVASSAEDDADVHALGVLLWRAVTAGAPIEGAVPQLEQHGSMSVAVNRILRTAMAENPSDRYPSAAAMRVDLLRAARLGEEPLSAAPPASGDEPPGAVRSPVLVVVLAVLVVVIAVVGGIAAPRLLDHGPSPGSPSSPTSTP
jgi:serine/threonine-protein kinase